jgi:hypothetical protein
MCTTAPFDFTDVKRDRMYIRDADAWTKHETNDKLIEVLELSARQACIRLTEWMKRTRRCAGVSQLRQRTG